MRIPNKFQGYSSNRYSREPLEKIFAECWAKFNTQTPNHPTIVDYISLRDKEEKYLQVATKEDYKFASTLVQWLGSAVGQGFLAEVIKEAKEEKVPLPMMEPVRGYFGAALFDPNWR